MPVPKKVATGSMIVATVATAVGLNLGVLDIGGSSSTETTAAVPAAEAAAVVLDDQTAAAGALPATAGLDGQAAAGAASALRVAAIVEVSSDSSAAPGDAAPSDHDDAGDHDRDDHDESEESDSDHSDSDHSDSHHDDSDDSDSEDDDGDEHHDMDRSSETTQTSETTTRSSATHPMTSSTQPATTQTTVAPTTQGSAAPVSRTEYKTYEFDGVASIIVAVHDGRRLEFWSAIPEDGWAYRVEADRPDKVKVKFRPINGGDEAVFEVKFDDGRLKVKREY